MRIPKRVNAVLDWMEQHFLALAIVVALVVVALVALLAPTAVGFPVAGFVLGAAAGGLLVHVRLSRRIARARADVDNLLRENGALRHRNTVLASGVITREAQETQALVAIPEDDLLLDEPDADPQKTATLDELLDGGDDPQTTDELPDQDAAPEAEEPEGEKSEPKELGDGDPQRTTVLPELPGLLGGGEEEEDTVRTRRRTRKA
ncbi:hypothetical protein [Actinomadura madurae]|uniref:hypothetical protein n=1 Tax=Actinomadura madurae TaxID=1993 RepID=UPI0020271172|nr:hypothetical protein [Actinomadura madurae]MCP9953780.1 hypothetical protein [Actinomadura madurae]MCP9970533.1 hypothetical protein [Actinomadura madurae]MCP9983008.1 hypothetical protein [Actinomadura madurae]URM99261.1 hypothetical protein LUW76_35795 [Actinomadura madurae]URN09941.1 hypothetical protein LUW74_45745 [Actinomadura madurae]